MENDSVGRNPVMKLLPRSDNVNNVIVDNPIDDIVPPMEQSSIDNEIKFDIVNISVGIIVSEKSFLLRGISFMVDKNAVSDGIPARLLFAAKERQKRQKKGECLL